MTMPPRRKQKSSAEKKEDAERQKRILSSKEKILSIKRMVLSIIERMIEKEVSKDWFLAHCIKLCHADYEDVVQERSIERLCGFPLCSNIIKQNLKQKYHISRVTNKVYDITERKCFCSNQCYKASNYLKAQLSQIPLYMRKEEKIKVHLLSDCDNRGSAGEEIIFHHTISSNDIDKVDHEGETSNNLKNILNEEVKKCADSLRDLKIKEHVFEKQYVFGDETPKKSDESLIDDKNESYSESDVDSDESSDENFFPSYDNVSVLSQRHMPIPETMKKSVLIPPQKHDSNLITPVQMLSLDFVIKVFDDWMTEDSMKYLLGEKHVYGVKAEQLFERMTATDPVKLEKLESIKNEYINLCLKIDSLPDDDDDLSDSLEFDINESSSSTASKKAVVEDKTSKKVFKRRPKRKSNGKGKRVTFATDTRGNSESPAEKNEIKAEEKVNSQNEEQIDQADERNSRVEIIRDQEKEKFEETTTENPLPEPAFPLVDSVSQNVLRKQVLTSKLKSVYTDLLPVAGLHYTAVREAVRKFVDTLSLTPTNIMFKPKQWRLISVVLLRVLTRTVLKDILNELQFLKLCEDPSMPIAIDLREIEKIVSHIISMEKILNLE